MSVQPTKFNLHHEALEETLEAIRLLVDYEKEDNTDLWNKNSGCLGFPAATLLLSYINAFGNLFYGETINNIRITTDTKTFQIINSSYFENHNIAPDTLDRLNDIYRNN